jgi:putative endopeptidase
MRTFFLAVTGLSLLAQSPTTPKPTADLVKAVDPTRMDLSVKPCDDFWRYSMGAWLKKAEVPAEYTSTGVNRELDERNERMLREILESAASTQSVRGSVRQKVGDFYASGMNETAIEKAGAAPLNIFLDRVSAIRDSQSLAEALAWMQSHGIRVGFDFSVGQDDKRSSVMIAQFSQGGLGLPERDYYLREDAASKTLRAKYESHIVKMLKLSGESESAAKAAATAIVALETRLAKASMTLVERRDPQAIYHRMSKDEFTGMAPAFAWMPYLKSLGLKEEEFLIRQPGFFKVFAGLTRTEPMETWKAYLRWHLLRSMAPVLSSSFFNESFAFYQRELRGVQEPLPRWKRVMQATDGEIGEALGQLYVERAFTPEAKAKIQALVANVKIALRARIEKLPWMQEATKKAALRKLDTMVVKVGYPDVWRDYGKLDIMRGSYFANVIAAEAFEFNRNLAKLGKPVDRNEWGMTPPTNNAYYNPTMNEIVFPAGILQPPFFDARYDDAINYGGIGATIGHEITHGFDDEGRQYDADGNLKEWWTEADAKAYKERAGLVVAQFNGFEPLPGMKVNGEATLGENIADLGGLLIAYDAFQIALKGQPKTAIDGFTPEQRFFLGYAESWRTKFRPEFLKLLLQTDVHSPAEQRVTGPLQNLLEFHQAFGCKDGQTMKREEKVRPTIW